jgi:hypothetical protein
MATVLPFNKKGIKALFKGVAKPILKISPFMVGILAPKLDQYTQLTFRSEGARRGRAKWMDYGKGEGVRVYLNEKTGTWRKRPGTDGSKSRRYSPSSKLLQASGGFRRSFGVLRFTPKSVSYGTNFNDPNPEFIMNNRQVLDINAQDETEIQNLFTNYVFKNMTFEAI